MNKRQRRDREHRARHFPLSVKPNRSRRARGKIRTSIPGGGLNHRGRYPVTHRKLSTDSV